MDEVTQQNAALVEEAAAAAESLEEQARGLVQAVGMFKLADGRRQHEPAGAGLARRDAEAAGPWPRPRSRRCAKPTAESSAPHLADDDEEWEEF